MPIFNDKTIDIQSGVASDPYDSTPNCSWNDFNSDTERALALQEFIYILKNPIYTSLLDQNSIDLYNKIFHFLVESDPNSPYDFTTTDTTSRPGMALPRLRLSLPDDLSHLSPGLLSEASYIFTLFFLSKQLAAATGYASESGGVYDNNYTINPANASFAHIFNYDSSVATHRGDLIYDRIHNGTMYDKRTVSIANDPMHIYTRFKDLFTKTDTNGNNPRFVPSTEDEWVEFAKIFDPKLKIGEEFSNDSTKLRMLNLMKKGNVSGNTDPKVFDTGNNNTITGDDLKPIIEVFLKKLDTEKKKIIEWQTGCFYSAITGEKQQPKNIMLATGNGSVTKGLIKIENLSIILFSYAFDTSYTAEVVSKNTNSELSKTPNGILHFNVFAYNNLEKSTVIVKRTSGNPEWTIEFEGNINVNHCLRPVRKSRDSQSGYYTIPDAYSNLDLSTHETLIESDKKTDIFWLPSIDEKAIKIGTFDREINDLIFANDTTNFPLEITLESGNADELQLMVNSVQDFRKTDEKTESIIISLSDLFTDDKFEVEKTKIDGLMSSVKDLPKLEKLINLICNEGYTFNAPSLKGAFVGKESDYIDPNGQDVVFDPDYLPSNDPSIPKHETTMPDSSYSKFRYSFGKITANEDKTIDIEIISFVSPLISRMDKRFTEGIFQAPYNPPDTNTFNNNYTLYPVTGYQVMSSNGQIPSYNQALATLRSMGLLEAIAIKMYNTSSQEEKPVILHKLTTMLCEASSEDKTAEVRGVDIATYQLSNIITYNNYNHYKWYSDTDDMKQYYETRNYEERIGFDNLEPVSNKRYEDYFIEKDSTMKTRVDDFITNLYNIAADSPSALTDIHSLVETSAKAIFDQAVSFVQAGNNANPDDRPLYWARIKMEAALKNHPYFCNQHLLSNIIQGSDLEIIIKLFEEKSRNYTGVNFSGAAGANKILITGFDPFFLNKFDYPFSMNILQSNPSGCTALAMHNTPTENGLGYIQIMIIPVRYKDFDSSSNPLSGQGEGIIENYIQPWINDVKMIVTISQAGPNDYKIDKYATVSRGGTIDNLGYVRNINSHSIDIGINSNLEWLLTTLPSPFIATPVVLDTNYTDSSGYHLNDSTPPNDSQKVQMFSGSGGNYLSNEIFYRVAKLREDWLASQPPSPTPKKATGHFHVSKLQVIVNEDFSITETQQLIIIVKGAINNGVTGL